MPHLTSTDGEKLLFHAIRFPFATGVLQTQVAAALGPVKDLEEDSPKSRSWLAPRSVASRAKRRRRGLALDTFVKGGTVLGSVEIKGKASIRAAAGDLPRPPLTTIQTVEQMMEQLKEHGNRTHDKADEVPPEIARQVMLE